MTADRDPQLAQALSALLDEALPVIQDDGFSSRVIGRLRRRLIRRRIVLVSVTLAGILLAAPALVQLLIAVSDMLTGLAAGAAQESQSSDIASLLAAIALDEFVGNARQFLLRLSTDFAASGLYAHSRMVIIMSIAAIGALISPRLLE